MNGQTDVNYFIGKIQNLSKGLSELEMDDVVKFGEEYGGRELHSEQMHQLRKFLDSFKKIEHHFKQRPEGFNHQEVLTLKIYLKNSETKAKENLREGWSNLIKIMGEAFKKLRDKEEGYKDLQKLVKMWEAIIAFHKEETHAR